MKPSGASVHGAGVDQGVRCRRGSSETTWSHLALHRLDHPDEANKGPGRGRALFKVNQQALFHLPFSSTKYFISP